MLTTIALALRSNKDVHDWQIRMTETVQDELYLIGSAVESGRKASRLSAQVILYHDHDGKRGSATLSFLPGRLDDCAERIRRAVYMASLAGNPPHELPGPFPQPEVPVCDLSLADNPESVIETWRSELVSAAAAEEQVRLSAAEFFAYRDQVHFMNSRGAQYSYPATRAFVEFVLLSSDGKNESENYHSVSVRRASDLDMQGLVRERAAYARDMLKVALPRTYEGPVVISGDPLGSLFMPFQARVDARYLYNGVFGTKVGDNLLGGSVKGDGLTLSVDATVPFGTRSAPVDAEGSPAQRIEIVQSGQAKAIVAGKRFADYLGIPATGAGGNTVVVSGETPEADLLLGPVVHLVSFSALQADPMSGAFVSEIRLGYEIGADGTRRPIKGGSVSGNVFTAFADCRMSREVIGESGYYGPRSIRFQNLSISGE